MEHELSARKRLGMLVRQARREAGYNNTQAWAEKVGRSDRQLLGLERGEKVGGDTYAAVSRALEWPLEKIPTILAGELEPAEPSTALRDLSDDALVEELRRRLAAAAPPPHTRVARRPEMRGE